MSLHVFCQLELFFVYMTYKPILSTGVFVGDGLETPNLDDLKNDKGCYEMVLSFGFDVPQLVWKIIKSKTVL